MDRLAILQKAHPFLSEADARRFLCTAYLTAHEITEDHPPGRKKDQVVAKLIDLEVNNLAATDGERIKHALSILKNNASN